MANNKLTASILSLLFVLLASSCYRDDPAAAIIKWKSDNETYFANMKDSSGYVRDTFKTIYGNVLYYYKITQTGNLNSTPPKYTSKVTVNYKGSMITGQVFQSTFSNASPVNDSTAKPVTFYTNQLITGWTANLLQMKTGEVRTVVLPQELGYGIYGMHPVVPAYTTLKFDIQLISYTN